MLAQVWSLGLGVTSAYAATGDPTELVGRAGAPALLDHLTGSAVPALERQAAPVGQVLQDRIRTDGLPLPGQATTVPDAFAIAAVLLPTVPPQPRSDVGPRASRSGAVAGTNLAATETTASAPSLADARTGLAQQATEAALAGGPASDGQPPTTLGVQNADQQTAERELTLAAVSPVDTSGDCTAVLVPIAAGVLLTGAAMYKHRGLPRGH